MPYPYALVRFNGVDLPDRNDEDDLTPGISESSLLDSIGGVFDYFGARQRLPRRRTITQRGRYLGETTYVVDEFGNPMVDGFGNYIVAGTAVEMLRQQIDTLLPQQGRRGTLVRLREDGVEQTCTARLLAVEYLRSFEDAGVVAELRCTFETSDPGWRSGTAVATSGNLADGLYGDLSIPNGGDVDLRDAVLTVERTSGTVTSVWVRNTIIDWTWTGSLGAGDILNVDDGAHTIRKGSTDAYSGFVRASTHTAHSWLELPQGTNPIRVTVTGGEATVTVTHYNRFR